MALQASGTIKFSEIATEFGYPTQNKLGNYRVSQTLGGLSNIPLDSGIPQSGVIKFSDFYSKRLNVVVDCYDGSAESRKSAKDDKWDNNNLTVIGGYTTKPSNTSGKKIIVHVNKTMSSANSSNQNICALRTGSWDSGTTLQVDVGAEGVILGAGGNGGDGADGLSDHGPTSGGGDGQNGNSALGIEYDGTVVNVLSGGQIRCGYGGGAGGRGARQIDSGADRTACGGGGGGGGGTPAGAAGEGGQRLSGTNDEVAPGQDGGVGGTAGATFSPSGGAGGSGGNNLNEAIGQTGGVGGDGEQSPGTATGGKNVGNQSSEDPGVNANAGGNGAAVRRTSGYTITINNSGTIEGSTTATGVA
tara:strand:- start:1418 stop:2494 length:1077 start_codon:yes stop_codon:yes gene_type:complete